MVMNNAWNGRNPAVEVKGGTNQSTYTQGDILYASSANTLSKLAIGANGTRLVSNGTVPSWSSVAGAGQLMFLNDYTASNDAEIDITSQIDGTYNTYMICCTQMRPDSGSNQFRMRLSTDNGATFEDTSGDYMWYTRRRKFDDGSLLTDNDNSSSKIDITPTSDDVKNSFGGGVNMIIWLYNPTSTSTYTKATWYGNYLRQQATGYATDTRGSGRTTFTDAVNAVRIYFRTGDITSGYVSIYGVGQS